MGLPEKFSPTENVAWVTDLPGIGSSSPIVWDDAVFVTAIDEVEDAVFAWPRMPPALTTARV